ncbi:MAG TPA: stage II sporulation protein M [Firmicutes bacterium]|nr:stage II sporulation protein M [Bacillota bacterium]HBR30025.1 stage II sporulation protein M [Bacillota bacterium]HBR33468.1 stage II sporulation protein M [Bacillota bacterium]
MVPLFLGQWRKVIALYIEERLFLFILVGLLFTMGIVFGTLSAQNLEQEQKNELSQYIQFFFQGMKQETTPVTDTGLARTAIFNHLKTIFFFVILGISVIGVPLILFLLFAKGYILGFTIGFILQQLMGKGFLFTVTSVFPHYVLIIPALMIAGVANIDLAGSLLKSRFGKALRPVSADLLQGLGLNGLAVLILIVSGLIEGFVSPLFIYWVAKLF